MVQYGGTVVLVAATADKTATPNATSFRSPSTTASARTRPARSPAASSSARAGRPRRKRSPRASSTARSARCSPRSSPTRCRCMCTVLSSDQENDSDVLALNGASAALLVSDIPFPAPIGGVRVGKIERRAGDQPDVRAARRVRPWTSWSPAPTTPSSWSRAARARSARPSCSRRCASPTGTSRLINAAGRPHAKPTASPSARCCTGPTPRSCARPCRGRLRRRALGQAIRIAGKEARQNELDAHHGRSRQASLAERFADQARDDRRSRPRPRAGRAARAWCSTKSLRADGRRRTRSARSAPRSRCCRARTARRCSPAARRRRWR